MAKRDSGTVVDDDTGEPVAGAFVMAYLNRVLAQNTMTDGNGRFELECRSMPDTVMVSMMGYKPVKVTPQAATMTIKLKAQKLMLRQATVPEPYIPKVGARIMSLGNPTSKMSKSDPQGCVFLMDKPEEIARKFKRAVTDSDTENCVRYAPEAKPGVANLMSIYSSVTGKSFQEIEKEFEGKGYGVFKPAVGEAVIETLRPVREEAERMLKYAPSAAHITGKKYTSSETFTWPFPCVFLFCFVF